jgi:hypothetical protein
VPDMVSEWQHKKQPTCFSTSTRSLAPAATSPAPTLQDPQRGGLCWWCWVTEVGRQAHLLPS